MASLKDATSRTVENLGLTREPHNDHMQKPVIPRASGLVLSRCPVPPVSISPDSLDNYDTEDRIPQYRILASLPLFQNSRLSSGNTTNSSSSSSSTVINSNTDVIGGGTSARPQSNSSTTSSSGLSFRSNIVTNTGIVTPAISQGIPYATSIQIASVFILYRVAVSSPARIELYSTAAFQTADLGRLATTPVAIGSENGIIVDLNLAQPIEAVWTCSPAPTGFNGDSSISSVIYLTVTNLSPSTTPITVNFSFLPLEGN